MYISLMEMYLILYVVLEQIIFERINSLPVTKQSTFSEVVQNLEVEEIMEEVVVEHEEKPLASPLIAAAEVSELDEGAMELLANLENQFEEMTVNEASDQDYCPPMWVEQEDGLLVEEDNYLSIHDLDEPSDIAHPVISQYAEPTPSADNGWTEKVVEVIGKEDEFLHVVTYGKRTWINVGKQEAARIKKKDILLVEMAETEKGLEIGRVLTLETDVSQDYVIPDEEPEMEMEISMAQ